MSQTRRLAAILAADIADSRPMGFIWNPEGTEGAVRCDRSKRRRDKPGSHRITEPHHHNRLVHCSSDRDTAFAPPASV